MKLYYHPESTHSRKVRALVLELGLALQEEQVDIFDGDQRHPSFLALNPSGQVPTLVDGTQVVTESNAIMQYLAEGVGYHPMWPADRQARTEVTRWQFWEASSFGPPVNTVVYETVFRGRMGLGDPSGAEIDRGLAWFHRCAKVLDQHLDQHPFLALDRLTLADLAVAAPLTYATESALPMRSYRALGDWLARIQSLDCWKKTAPPEP